MSNKTREENQIRQIEDTQRIVEMIRRAFPDDFTSPRITESMWMAMQMLSSPSQAAAVIRQSSLQGDEAKRKAERLEKAIAIGNAYGYDEIHGRQTKAIQSHGCYKRDCTAVRIQDLIAKVERHYEDALEAERKQVEQACLCRIHQGL